MKKTDINSDKYREFRRVCYCYGFDAEYSLFLKNIIIVPGDKNNLYLIFDNKCNILGIEEYNKKDGISYVEYFQKKYNLFFDNDQDDMFVDLMSDSFEYFTLSMIQDIAKRCYFCETDRCLFDKNIIEDKYLEELLSYFKFLDLELHNYSYISCSMQKLGYNVPDFITYLKSIVEKLDMYINLCIEQNKIPYPVDFITFLSQSNLKILPKMLDNIFNLLLREKGYEKDYESKKLKEIGQDENFDVSEISMKLIKIM